MSDQKKESQMKESLNKDIQSVNQKKEEVDEFHISPEFLEEARRSLDAQGPLYVDEKYKKPGYVLEWTNDVPGNISRKERLGFKIVQDESIRVGDEKPNQAHRLGSAVICMWKNTIPMVLMEIDEQRYRAIQIVKRERVQLTEKSMGRVENVPTDYTYGEVTGHKGKD